jgi:methylated-DNA-[protein]-cysteine S-methyltransferase
MTTQGFDAIISAPFGAIGIRTQDDFLLGVELIPDQLAEKIPQHPFAQSVIRQFQQYFNNPGTSLDIPYAVLGTPFQKRVWCAISSINACETMTYSELANMVGSGPRAVANACGANPVPLVIPCHRVVAKHGLGGFMQGQENGLAIKRWLLNHERQR